MIKNFEEKMKYIENNETFNEMIKKMVDKDCDEKTTANLLFNLFNTLGIEELNGKTETLVLFLISIFNKIEFKYMQKGVLEFLDTLDTISDSEFLETIIGLIGKRINANPNSEFSKKLKQSFKSLS